MAETGVIYGPTGSFKTTAVAHFARYIVEVTGKATLLLSADGGGWKSAAEEIGYGAIIPYRCDTGSIPLPILRKISQGYWPTNEGETDVSKLDFRPINWNDIGAIAVEGLTSISDMLMLHYAEKQIMVSGEKQAVSAFSQPILVNGQITKETFSSNSQGHYGDVQKRIYSMVINCGTLPCRYVLFTAHEAKSEEQDRSTTYGPAIAGKKATPMVGAWVGDLIHAHDETVKRLVKGPDPSDSAKQVEVEVLDAASKYFFKKHPDPVTGINFPAKPRVTHSQVAELTKIYPGGYFVPTPEKGFDEYLRTIDRLNEQAMIKPDPLREWREKRNARRSQVSVPAPAREVAKS